MMQTIRLPGARLMRHQLGGHARNTSYVARATPRRVWCRAEAEGTSGSSSQQGIAYPVVSALGALGMAETAYLTYVKLFDTPLVCPTSGCETILESAYSSLFGVPLSFFGLLTYGTVVALAATASNARSTDAGSGDAQNLDNALLSGVTLLASCSAALMYIIQVQFGGEVCAWCYLSAGLSFSLLATVVAGMGMGKLRLAAAPGAGALVTSLAVLYFGFGNVGSSNAEIVELPYYKPEVTTESSKQAVGLVQRLRDSGAKMYGAFWCSHCFEQKQTFGKETIRDFPYVECYPEGWKRGAPMVDACQAAGVRAFPTWVINGRTVEGELTLEAIQMELDTPVGMPSPMAVEEEQAPPL